MKQQEQQKNLHIKKLYQKMQLLNKWKTWRIDEF